MVLAQEGSSMKKFVILVAVFFLAAFMLLPGSGNGKYNVSKPVVADGWPLPPSVLPGVSNNIWLADGGPIPPFPPPPKPPVQLSA